MFVPENVIARGLTPVSTNGGCSIGLTDNASSTFSPTHLRFDQENSCCVGSAFGQNSAKRSRISVDFGHSGDFNLP